MKNIKSQKEEYNNKINESMNKIIQLAKEVKSPNITIYNEHLDEMKAEIKLAEWYLELMRDKNLI